MRKSSWADEHSAVGVSWTNITSSRRRPGGSCGPRSAASKDLRRALFARQKRGQGEREKRHAPGRSCGTALDRGSLRALVQRLPCGPCMALAGCHCPATPIATACRDAGAGLARVLDNGHRRGMCSNDEVVVGWQAAAELAGKSASSVRRLAAKGAIHAEKAGDGRTRLRKSELEALRAASPPTQVPGTEDLASTDLDHAHGRGPDPDGELAARAFRLFGDGRDAAEAVIELKRPPEVVDALHKRFSQMSGALIIPRETRRAIESRIGAELTPDELLEHVERLLFDRFELQRFHYPCARCGTTIQASAEREWADVVAQGALADWGCSECE